MKLACIVSDVPAPRHDRPGVMAVNVMLHQLLMAVGRRGHSLTLLPVFSRFRKSQELSPEERERFDDHRRDGVDVAEPVFPASFLPPPRARSLSRRAFETAGRFLARPTMAEFYPAIRAAGVVQASLDRVKPDAILSVWSLEGVAATHGYRKAPHVAYHGDVDSQLRKARLEQPALFDGVKSYPWWTTFNRRREVANLESIHWDLMREVDCIANITACNADYYRSRGHKRSVYVRNTWMDSGRRPAPNEHTEPVKIIGHFGALDRTGSTFGLRFLLSVLPELEKEMAGIDYEVHVIGGGQPVPGVRDRLRHPRLKIRGFVPDLDSELAEAAAVMMLNNAGPYQAAFTRHIVAWSLGSCLIVHDNSRLAIPEIKPDGNALCGGSPSAVAKAVRRAVTDQRLNRRLRDEGRMTYERDFRPDVVAGLLDNELRRCVEER